jgi:UPF0755 protein
VGKLFGFLITLLVLAGAALVAAYFYGVHVYTKDGPETAGGAAHVVMVDRGATSQAVATKLKQAGAIGEEYEFNIAVRVLNTIPGGEKISLKAGEYAIPARASIKDIIELMAAGKSLQYAVIIPEGLTSAMIMKLLAEKEWRSTSGAGAPVKLAGPPPVTPAEGVMLPGDYAVLRGATIESVVQRSIKAQNDLMAELWPNRQPGLPSDIKTPQDAIKLASIVENETGIPSERPQVAALFVNRLRRPMRLQSDPTVVYGISQGVPLGHGLTVSELARDHAWNTYQIDGLPKTPICNPGRASIEAVLNPPQSKFYYFVADGTGGHVFAETLAEHNANVAKWRQVEKQRDAARTPPAPAKPKP